MSSEINMKFCINSGKGDLEKPIKNVQKFKKFFVIEIFYIFNFFKAATQPGSKKSYCA